MEGAPEPSGPGSVVLDIGGDVGAAIVHAPPFLAGAEIEIRRLGAPWDGRHVAMRARHVPAGAVYAALFASLERGRYQVRVRNSDAPAPLTTFDVAGGQVAEVRLTPGH